jgi:mRNA interferase RelE/StbE
MRYDIKSHKNFRKAIKKVPKRYQGDIYRALYRLAENPRKLPVKTKLLVGFSNVYRMRFGDYRLVIHIDNKRKMILVIAVGSRGQVYRIIERLLN